MSFGFCVHFDRRRQITIEQWRASIGKLGYPLELPDRVDALDSAGYVDCTFGGKPASFSADLNDECELPSPFPSSVERVTMEFTVHSGDDEIDWFAAVVAGAAFCIATDGVIEEDGGARTPSRRARSWTKSILKEDDAMTKAALAHPHPDGQTAEDIKGPLKPWWKWWSRV